MYIGTKLHDLCKKERGLASRLSRAVLGTDKGIDRYYKDGMNITIEKLEKIARYTGKPVSYFLDDINDSADDASHPHVYGNHNIVNSPMANDLAEKVQQLKDVIKLKDEIIASERANSASKDEIIKNLKERLNDQVTIMKEMGTDK